MSVPQNTADALKAELDRHRLELETLKDEQGSSEIYVGQYLLARLEQLGVKSMFGVPGDFNLGFLDLVEDHPTIDWVGNCNELNAAYAADGYARVKEHSLGVVLTTFGVGELSAINGIAGAFSEMVPVLHIAGVPSTVQQKTKPMLHHTLGDGRFDAYQKAAEQFVIAHAYLNNTATAAAQIDRVLEECIIKARPTYLTLPTDICYKKISSGRLKIPLSRLPPPNDPDTENFVLDEIVRVLQETEKAEGDVIVLVDACAVRHDVRQEVDEFVKVSGLPVYVAPMGKTSVCEAGDRYGGIYVGSISRPEIRSKVESASLIISIGSLKSDFNTGNFTYSIPTARTIELHSYGTNVKYANFPGIGMKELLPKLTSRLASLPQNLVSRFSSASVPAFTSPIPDEDGDVISQSWFWPRVGQFFKPKDVIIAETGTSSFGILDVALPEDAIFVSQILWGSIGWTVGSTLGAALAARERQLGRPILFIGDGSLQLTVQELSAMLRHDLKPIIFVLNNSGYTIERFLHGKERKYNDISNWEWTSLLRVLGDLEQTQSSSYTVRTKAELSKLLDDDAFASSGKMRLVEVIMDKFDAPRALKMQAELSGKTNKYVG